MASDHLIFLSVAGLRPADIDKNVTPTLYAWAQQGALASVAPTFPCVTSCVQATMSTGSAPGQHGVIANGFLDRNSGEVEFWVGKNEVIAGEQIWEAIHARRPEFTSAVWHAQNIKGAAADFIVTPAPIHEPDGTMKLWCYSKPEGLYQRLLDTLGHFPLQHYWGPMAGIESTRWILDAAFELSEQHAPNFQWIYIPHLDYAAQKFGPNSPEVKTALGELDDQLGAFARKVANSSIGDRVVFLVAGEYALTEVTGVVYPNRILRDAGLLAVHEKDGHECVDVKNSAAFAMVDHQLAHVYLGSCGSESAAKVAELFSGVPGVAAVHAGDSRDKIGMGHKRSGEIILIADHAHWFAYYWWVDDRAAPPFARTVDIHAKPGYDPVELFFDPATKGIPLDASLVRGSHGAPASSPQHHGALICSEGSEVVRAGQAYRDYDIKCLVMALLDL